MIFMAMALSIAMLVSAFLWDVLGLMERRRVTVVADTTMVCPDCGSVVYFAEDMGKCRSLGPSSSSSHMNEWDESFVDELFLP